MAESVSDLKRSVSKAKFCLTSGGSRHSREFLDCSAVLDNEVKEDTINEKVLSRSCGCDRVQARSRRDVVTTPPPQRYVRDRSVTEGHESDRVLHPRPCDEHTCLCNDCGLEMKLGYVQQDNRMCTV